MRISDWSSDVCSSDLGRDARHPDRRGQPLSPRALRGGRRPPVEIPRPFGIGLSPRHLFETRRAGPSNRLDRRRARAGRADGPAQVRRSEEHTSELQSLMRISYAVFCLKKKNKIFKTTNTIMTYIYTQNTYIQHTHNI